MPKSPQKAAKPVPVKAPAKGDHVFLVDGSGYIFRAYHALPPLSRKSDGLQVNAVLGFCNMLWKLMRDMKPEDKPTHLAVIFDKSEKTFRNELYKDYKAHRPDAPADLIPQFPLIRDATRAFDIPCLEMLGFEADDLIATYARQACAVGANVTIVSSDKDLMQLVNDCVIMYDTMKDKKIGIAEVIEKFGVGPDKVIKVQSLIGDSTDNVPGVPGIGVKTAAQLIGEFGDLETLLSRAGEIKQQKRRETLIENAEKARLSKKLVTLDDKVKLDVPLDELAVHEPDHKLLIAFLKAMEFSSLTRRVAEFAGVDASAVDADATLVSASKSAAGSSPALQGEGGERGEPAGVTATPAKDPTGPASPATLPLNGGGKSGAMSPQSLYDTLRAAAGKSQVDRTKYETVRTIERLRHWIDRALDLGVIAIDTETTNLDPMQAELCGISLALTPNEACYIPLSHRAGGEGGNDSLFAGSRAPDQLEERDALAALKPLFEDPSVLKVAQNLKYDYQIFALRGIEMTACDDTMLMSYVVDAGKRAHGIDAMAEQWLSYKTLHYGDVAGNGKAQVCFDQVSIEKATEYAAEDADVTLRLWHIW